MVGGQWLRSDNLFHRDLWLTSANGNELGVEGYDELHAGLGNKVLTEPFVVTSIELGYNAIANFVCDNLIDSAIVKCS